MPIGTLVRLASGGPMMLVTEWDDDREYVWCEWDGCEKPERFRIVCLDVVRTFALQTFSKRPLEPERFPLVARACRSDHPSAADLDLGIPVRRARTSEE